MSTEVNLSKLSKRQYQMVSDGHDGMIVPDELVAAIEDRNKITPEDKNFRQTPEMLFYEMCAGTVIKTTKTTYTARFDGKNTLTVDGQADVGDRVLSYESGTEDGGSWTVAIGKAAELDEYKDGESVIVYITPTEEPRKGNMKILPTTEKHVRYPRMATIDGVKYPYVVFEDNHYAIVKTFKGWTIGGSLAEAQHKENVAFLRSEPVTTLIQ
jgi:hypothetical protein